MENEENEVLEEIEIGTVCVVPKGLYSDTEQYDELNIVFYEGSSYISKIANKGIPITNNEVWYPLVTRPQKGSDYFTEEDKITLINELKETESFNHLLDSKVDKKDGYGLSQENFTSILKEKLEQLENYEQKHYRKEVVEVISANDEIDLDFRYKSGMLEVFYCSERLIKDEDYEEIFEEGQPTSNKIKILFDVPVSTEFPRYFDFVVKGGDY